MGTNFYLRALPKCEHCGRGPDLGLHIGKSSAGWCFGLRVYPLGAQHRCEEELRALGVEHISSLEDWTPLILKHGAVNEYGEDIVGEEMLRWITERGFPRPDDIDAERWARDAGGVPGPNGLIRRRVDRHCVAHGPGTWDLIASDFS